MPDSRVYSSRKFIMTVGTIILTFVLAIVDKLTAEWGLAIAAALGFYNGLNVAQKYVENRREHLELRREERYLEDDSYYQDGYRGGYSRGGRRY